MEETMFIDPQRCIGCRSCVAACRECGTHKGYSMIYVDYLDRGETTATMPTVCMHCVEPTCALVCPADAIKVSEEGIVMTASTPRCLDCRNCVNACPFGHVFGNQKVETKVYVMLPTDADAVKVDGCGVFEGRVRADEAPREESWIDLQVEESDKSNEF